MELADFIATWSLHAASRHGTLASLQARALGGTGKSSVAAHWWRSSGWSPRHSRIPLTSCLGGTGGSPVVAHQTQNSTTSVAAFSHPSRLVPREGPVRVRPQAHRRRAGRRSPRYCTLLVVTALSHPSRLVPREGPARVRSWRIGGGAGGRSPRHSRIPLKAVLWGDRRESGRGASIAELDDVCRGTHASLKARASGGTGGVRPQALRRRNRQTTATVLHAASRHGTLASLKARASGGTGESSAAS